MHSWHDTQEVPAEHLVPKQNRAETGQIMWRGEGERGCMWEETWKNGDSEDQGTIRWRISWPYAYPAHMSHTHTHSASFHSSKKPNTLTRIINDQAREEHQLGFPHKKKWLILIFCARHLIDWIFFKLCLFLPFSLFLLLSLPLRITSLLCFSSFSCHCHYFCFVLLFSTAALVTELWLVQAVTAAGSASQRSLQCIQPNRCEYG